MENSWWQDQDYDGIVVITFEGLLCDFYPATSDEFNSMKSTNVLNTQELCPSGMIELLPLFIYFICFFEKYSLLITFVIGPYIESISHSLATDNSKLLLSLSINNIDTFEVDVSHYQFFYVKVNTIIQVVFGGVTAQDCSKSGNQVLCNIPLPLNSAITPISLKAKSASNSLFQKSSFSISLEGTFQKNLIKNIR